MRQPKPFYRAARKQWFVQIGKKQIALAAAISETDADGKKAAWEKYYALMAGNQAVTPDSPVIEVLAKFKAWNKKHRSAGTVEFYDRQINAFGTHVGQGLTMRQLKPLHVTAWLDADYSTAGSNYRRNCIRAIQRALNWAVEEGHIEASPLKRMKKPAATPRDAVVTPDEWEQIVALLSGRCTTYGGRPGRLRSAEFLDFVTLLRQTGCRPQEARLIEARHLDRRTKCIVFERHESKGSGGGRTTERRVVPLADEAFAMCCRLALLYPGGPLFRNEDGRPWTMRALGRHFERIAKTLKIKISAYVLRHTFATDALVRGVDPVTLATLMGHRDLTQLMKTYQHLKTQGDFLRASMAKAIGAA